MYITYFLVVRGQQSKSRWCRWGAAVSVHQMTPLHPQIYKEAPRYARRIATYTHVIKAIPQSLSIKSGSPPPKSTASTRPRHIARPQPRRDGPPTHTSSSFQSDKVRCRNQSLVLYRVERWVADKHHLWWSVTYSISDDWHRGEIAKLETTENGNKYKVSER